MKLVFLDIDGVLNNRETYRKDIRFHGFTGIDPELVTKLNSLVRDDIKFVLSSTWRLSWSLDELATYLVQQGFKGNRDSFIGKTPNSWRGYRGGEIEEWLEEQAEQPEKFIIIDDGSDMEPYMDHLVQTDYMLGLTDADVQKALGMLNSD